MASSSITWVDGSTVGTGWSPSAANPPGAGRSSWSRGSAAGPASGSVEAVPTPRYRAKASSIRMTCAWVPTASTASRPAINSTREVRSRSATTSNWSSTSEARTTGRLAAIGSATSNTSRSRGIQLPASTKARSASFVSRPAPSRASRRSGWRSTTEVSLAFSRIISRNPGCPLPSPVRSRVNTDDPSCASRCPSRSTQAADRRPSPVAAAIPSSSVRPDGRTSWIAAASSVVADASARRGSTATSSPPAARTCRGPRTVRSAESRAIRTAMANSRAAPPTAAPTSGVGGRNPGATTATTTATSTSMPTVISRARRR